MVFPKIKKSAIIAYDNNACGIGTILRAFIRGKRK